MLIHAQILFITICLIATFVAGEFSYELCSLNERENVIIHDIKVLPDPIVKDKTVAIHVNATVLADIQHDAYIVGEARFMFIKFPIRETRIDRFLELPIKRGSYSESRMLDNEELHDLPPGHYDVHLEGRQRPSSTNSGLLFCVDFQVDLADYRIEL